MQLARSRLLKDIVKYFSTIIFDNSYNSKPKADKLIDYIWLHSGKKISPSLWANSGEGIIGDQRVVGFHSNGQGLLDHKPEILYPAACELRSD